MSATFPARLPTGKLKRLTLRRQRLHELHDEGEAKTEVRPTPGRRGWLLLGKFRNALRKTRGKELNPRAKATRRSKLGLIRFGYSVRVELAENELWRECVR